MHSWAVVEGSLTSWSEAIKKKDQKTEILGRGKWVALWEWAQSGESFVKHTYVPLQASFTGEALNPQADRTTWPADIAQPLADPPSASPTARK